MERGCRLAGVRADVFGSATDTIRGHGITPRPTTIAGAAGSLGPDASFMSHFDAHFTALSAVAAGSNVVQESLAAAAMTQYSAILSKLDTLKALYVAPGGGDGGGGGISNNGNNGGGGGGSDGGSNRPFNSDDHTKAAARINQLQAEIRGSWITGSASKLCSTHGWGLGPGHDSMLCI